MNNLFTINKSSIHSSAYAGTLYLKGGVLHE